MQGGFLLPSGHAKTPEFEAHAAKTDNPTTRARPPASGTDPGNDQEAEDTTRPAPRPAGRRTDQEAKAQPVRTTSGAADPRNGANLKRWRPGRSNAQGTTMGRKSTPKTPKKRKIQNQKRAKSRSCHDFLCFACRHDATRRNETGNYPKSKTKTRHRGPHGTR